MLNRYHWNVFIYEFGTKRGYASGVHLSAIWENTTLVQWIRCEPLGEPLIHWTCPVFSRTKNEQRLYFLTRSRHTWHNCHRLLFKLQLECDMGWYRYPSHSENYCAECENYLFHLVSQMRVLTSAIITTWVIQGKYMSIHTVLCSPIGTAGRVQREGKRGSGEVGSI